MPHEAPGEKCFSSNSLKEWRHFVFSCWTLLWIYNPQNNHCSHLCHFVNFLCKGQLCHWLLIPSKSWFYMRSSLGPPSRRRPVGVLPTVLIARSRSHAAVGRLYLLISSGPWPGWLSLHPTQLASDLNSVTQKGTLENPHFWLMLFILWPKEVKTPWGAFRDHHAGASLLPSKSLKW